MTKKRLFEDFPPVSSEEWKAKVIADLNGADYDKKLVWKTEEGFDVHPYYRQEDLETLTEKEIRKDDVSSRQDNPEKLKGAGEQETIVSSGQGDLSSGQGDAGGPKGAGDQQVVESSGQKDPGELKGDQLRGAAAAYSGQGDPEKVTEAGIPEGAAPVAETIKPDWKIRQDFAPDSSPESLNRKILNAVSRGAQSVGIDMSAIPGVSEKNVSSLSSDKSLSAKSDTSEESPATPHSGNSQSAASNDPEESLASRLSDKILSTTSDASAESLEATLSDNNLEILPEAFIKSLEKLFAGINLTTTELNFLNVHQPLSLLQALSGLASSTGTDPAQIKGSVGFDPIKKLTAEGKLTEQDFDELSDCLKTAAASLPGIRLITIDAGILQDSGSTLSQELGFGLAMANDYFDRLTGRGHTPTEIAATMLFSFATGPNYFMEIAKLRAARWLWRAVCKEWGVEDKQSNMYIYSRTASWNLTLYDPHVNMLRTTTETMSASLGSSDAISVHPFDMTFREENEFSSRIARNTQLILKEEAYFNKVADPAAGSYYIEQLTASIAEQAWKHFLETEEQGGYIEAFKKGWIQEQVTASAEVKRSKASSGRTSILGVNKYPAFAELVLNQGVSLPAKKRYENATYPPLLPFSAAEEIEQLRLQTERSKKRPRVFLLKYGEPAWMTARGMFAGNFFACAGYEIIDNRGFESVDDGIAAARKAKADIVVLCSADAAYPDTAPAVYEAMKGSAEVVIAGYPKDSVEQLRQQGVHHFIHVKSNLLGELQKFQSLLNINKA
jgi:methylmalonyl-CoA mutase